jgi:hypothetical protein
VSRCAACGEDYEEHIPTVLGPATCRRIALGEGAYEYCGTQHFGVHCSTCGGPCDGHESYRFVPIDQLPPEVRAQLDKFREANDK